ANRSRQRRVVLEIGGGELTRYHARKPPAAPCPAKTAPQTPVPCRSLAPSRPIPPAAPPQCEDECQGRLRSSKWCASSRLRCDGAGNRFLRRRHPNHGRNPAG